MGSLISRALKFFQTLKKRVRTRNNYDNLENVGEADLLTQSTTDTTKGSEDATQQVDRSSSKQDQVPDQNKRKTVKLPKLRSLVKSHWLSKETSTTAASLPIEGGDRIAALKQQLFEQKNKETLKKTFIPMVRSMSEGNVAKKRRSLDKIFAAKDKLIPTLYPLFPKPVTKKNVTTGKPSLERSLSAGICEMAKKCF